MNKILRVVTNGHVPSGLYTLVAGLCMSFFINLASADSIQKQESMRQNVNNHIRFVEVEKHDTSHSNDPSYEATGIHTVDLSNENTKDYGHRPIRALQIPGYVLEAITSNLGTELITVD